jgi:hypothetical protein
MAGDIEGILLINNRYITVIHAGTKKITTRQFHRPSGSLLG